MNKLRYLSVLLATLYFYSCFQKNIETEDESTILEANDTIIYRPVSQLDNSIEINPYIYESIDSLYSKINKITCNKKFPSISFESSESFKKVILMNSCPHDIGCHYYRNLIMFYNDSIKRYYDSSLPLDSFPSLLEKHLKNYGQDPDYADAPRMLLIQITFDTLIPSLLIERLDFITKKYQEVKDTTDIKIRLYQEEQPSLELLDTFKN